MKFLFTTIILLLQYLALSQEPRLVMPVGHTLAVNCVAFSNNGKYLVSGGRDNNALVWDVASGRLLHVLRGHTEMIAAVQFSPDDSKILLAGYDNITSIWDFYSGKKIAVLQPSTQPDPFKSNVIKEAFYTNDGKYIITKTALNGTIVWDATTYKKKNVFDGKYGSPNAVVVSRNSQNLFYSDNTKVVMANIETGSIVKEFSAHTKSISHLSINNNNQTLLSTDIDGKTMAWNIETGEKLFDITVPSVKIVASYFSPDNTHILTLSSGNDISIWNAEKGKNIYSLTEKSEQLKSNHFSPDGKCFITSPNNGVVKIWDTKTGKKIGEVIGNANYGLVECAQFSNTNNTLAVGSWDRAIHLWDYTTLQKNNTLAGHTYYANTVQYSKDGKYYVTASDDSTARIVDATTGANLFALNGHKQHVLNSQFSPDNKYVLTVSKDATAIIWENGTGKLLHHLKGHTALIFRGEFNSDATKVVTASNDKTAKVWNVQTGNLLLDLKGHTDEVWNAHFSSDGKKIVTASLDGSAIIWDAVNGSKLFTLTDKQGAVSDAIFSKDNQKVLIMGEFKEPIVWDANTGKGLFILGGHKQSVYAATFSNNNQYIVTGARDGTAGIWNATTGAFIKELKGHTNQITSVQFSNNDENIVTASQDRTAIIWNTKTAQQIQVLKGHTDFIRAAEISPDGNHILTVSEDNTIKQWNIQQQQLDYTRVQIDKLDYLVKSPTGYYFSSPDAAKKLHYVTNDLKVLSFDQFDIQYNRPDIVLKKIKPTDSALINSYHKAFVKRIKKLGIDTAQFKAGFQVPVSDFANRNTIVYNQTTGKLTVKIKAVDSSYTLDRFNIWINEVPHFGLRGIKVKPKNNFDTTITITLSQGENRIETSVINVNGTESYKMPLFVKYAPTKPIEEKQYFIGIGINQFAKPEYNLSWSVKDIRDLALKLKTKYPSIIIDTLFDKNVTKENVLALKQKLLQLKEDDKVIVSYSGHGVLSKDFDYFLSTYSINFNNPAEKGLAYDDLESLLDNIKPRKKLMLIDACHSGEVDKEEIAKIEAAKSTLNNNGVTTKSTIKVVKKEKQLGMTNSFELMQSLFVNVGKGTGATIISAAGGMQYAQERGDLKNGVFTYSLIEAFNQNPTLKVSELKKKVGERVTQLTNGLQKPTSRNETNNYDWVIW